MDRRGLEKTGSRRRRVFQVKDTYKDLQRRNSGKGSAVVRAEVSEVHEGHILKGLECQAKEVGLDPEGNGHREKAIAPPFTRSVHRPRC